MDIEAVLKNHDGATLWHGTFQELVDVLTVGLPIEDDVYKLKPSTVELLKQTEHFSTPTTTLEPLTAQQFREAAQQLTDEPPRIDYYQDSPAMRKALGI